MLCILLEHVTMGVPTTQFCGKLKIYFSDISNIFLERITYNLFYQKLDAKYFFIQQFFGKKNHYFLRKTMKNCFEGTFDDKINVSFLSQIRYSIFYHLAVFSKKAVFSEKTAKNSFWGPKSLLKGRGRLAMKMNITFFMRT